MDRDRRGARKSTDDGQSEGESGLSSAKVDKAKKAIEYLSTLNVPASGSSSAPGLSDDQGKYFSSVLDLLAIVFVCICSYPHGSEG